jgi:hypothetical protein
MITCLEFRRRVGAEPAASDADIEAHRQGCAACARYQDELRALDVVIGRALRVELPSAKAVPAAGIDLTAPRRRLFAIAASLVGGIAIGIVLLVGAPRESVAREVMDHVTREEAESMSTSEPLAPAALAGVLDPDGTRLRSDIGDVTFAARCVVDGRVVPHLVVRMREGPVTVLMLRHRTIGKPVRFAEAGHVGVVMPAPKGSIAIVGAGIADLDAVARKVYDAVDWQ